VAVYSLGVGDPVKASGIPTALGPLQHGGKEVQTRLQELPLQEIARRTDGLYFPARTQPLPRGALYREILQGQARHADRDVPLAAAHPRYPWFFGTALGLFAASLFLAGGRRRRPEDAEAAAGTPAEKEGRS
jgi:hypothetical protein